MTRSALAIVALLAALAACKDDAPPLPTALFAVTEPSANAKSGVALLQQPVIQLQDASGRNVAKAGVPVTASIVSGGGTLSGTTMVATNDAGQAVFTDLVIAGTIGARVLGFSAPDLAAANSGTITLTAGPASQLALTTPLPSTFRSGVVIAPPPVVQLRDAAGNDAPESGIQVVVSLITGGGNLTGNTVATDANGQAVFTSLAISGTVGPRMVAFTAMSIGLVSSGPTSLIAGVPEQLALTTQPSTDAHAGVAFPQQPVVQLRDGAGNDVAQNGVAVTAGIRSGGGTLAGTTTVASNDAGQVAFTNLAIDGAAGTRVLSFTGDGLTDVNSAVITVTIAGCTLESLPDTDNDRLPDCVESNTGVYTSPLITGTDPLKADTDGDGIKDGDEVLGTLAGLRLPQMGLNPLRKNLLIEYDWFTDALECSSHSHRPTAAMATRVADAFAAAPVNNPDGSTGITVISDYGQGGEFTGGNLINDADGVLTGGVNNAEFIQHKNANFDPIRAGYFYYAILPHRYGNSNSSGQAELPGNDMIVSLQCFGSERNVSHTIMHEWGHNLGLHHGGFEPMNYKPNYNSVMNYKYQFPGVDNDCTPPGNDVLDYSRGERPDLNEANLDERNGVCGPGGPPWDWNGNLSPTDFGFPLDINVDGNNVGDGALTVLSDNNDWAMLTFQGLQSADGMYVSVRVIDCTNIPFARARR